MKTELLKKIENKEIEVGVVGLGYVGLPLAVEKAKAGFKTIGFDVQEEKVNLVNEGHNYIGDVVDSDLKKLHIHHLQVQHGTLLQLPLSHLYRLLQQPLVCFLSYRSGYLDQHALERIQDRSLLRILILILLQGLV